MLKTALSTAYSFTKDSSLQKTSNIIQGLQVDLGLASSSSQVSTSKVVSHFDDVMSRLIAAYRMMTEFEFPVPVVIFLP
jgi:fructose-bisphosphate aldolase class 1